MNYLLVQTGTHSWHLKSWIIWWEATLIYITSILNQGRELITAIWQAFILKLFYYKYMSYKVARKEAKENNIRNKIWLPNRQKNQKAFVKHHVPGMVTASRSQGGQPYNHLKELSQRNVHTKYEPCTLYKLKTTWLKDSPKHYVHSHSIWDHEMY